MTIIDRWKPLQKLTIENQNILRNKLEYISLKPGQELNDSDHLPPGLLFLEEGQMRLLALDQMNEPFTLKRFNSGDVLGVEQLLRGVTGEILAASTEIKGQLLPAEDFLAQIYNSSEFLKSFCNISVSELYSVTAASNDPKIVKGRDLLTSVQNEMHKEYKVELLYPGDFHFESDWGNCLVSSINIENKEVGSLLSGPIELKVVGKLPARLIRFPGSWPPFKSTINRHSENSRSKEEKEQKEALEDWYGGLNSYGSFPHIDGSGPVDEPFACFRMLARFFDLPFRREVLKSVLNDQLNRSSNSFLGLQHLAAICDLLGLRSTSLTSTSVDQIERLLLPSLIIKNGHPLILWQHKKHEILIGSPSEGQNWIPTDKLLDLSVEDGLEVLSIECNKNTPKARFGLKWFLPAIKKHRYSLIQVVLSSFFVQLLALFNPLLIQQIIDAVISQGNRSSLSVLGPLLIAMALAQALLGSLRTYLFTDTTNRIDISLGSSIIHHMLRLPLGYFARRPVGEISSRIGELEKIRSFLTGTALTVLLDSIFSFIYIGVMLLYSVQLTLWALAVLPIFILVTVGAAPIIRQQLRQQAEANARVQSHLVETLSGMETVKGQGMELPSEWRWQQLYSGQIQYGFNNTITSTAAGSASQFLEQISGLLVIWIGATLVLNGEMTLGQLIAFRILSGYVTSPLLRLASLWQNFQETSLSLERLSDIVDQPEEIEITGKDLPLLPPIKGAIDYEGINFRFGKKGPLQLLNINLSVQAGEFVGIVGSSGSGKSTLLKLLTRLFDPIEGTIRVDGNDISKVDLYSLRSQVGLVPQDSLLFDGTIQANIALARPEASFDEICHSAKIACAHDFIQELPSGYNSPVGERGSGLSGGQRQRIAIARMVLKKPKLLVLDEATSALDVDTEQQLTKNLAEEYQKSTVLFITHRLGTLKNANTILVMHQGALVEKGSHNELMELDGRYATLYRQQEALME